jgi:tetratricopeptide (TPR) repeat protein
MPKPESQLPPQSILAELRRVEVLEQTGQWEDVDACYARLLDADESPLCRIAFGSSLATRERFNEAICQFTEALDVASASGDREALSAIFHNLAAVYRELGDPDLARRFQQRSVQQMDDCGPAELLGLANDAWLSDRKELAAFLSTACIDFDDPEQVDLEAQATASVIAGLTSDPREAIRPLIEVFRQHKRMNNLRLMGIDLLNLSALVGELERFRTEIQLVQQAINCFERAPAPVSANKARQHLSMLQRMQSLRNFDPQWN